MFNAGVPGLKLEVKVAYQIELRAMIAQSHGSYYRPFVIDLCKK
jgi:hypothetical protein